ncbi:MAG: NMD3-related protein [Candidatus Thermoplasmatota archaeon]|nr:NMD3-related protein [Candidatus Thermoplasmatota archaeon]
MECFRCGMEEGEFEGLCGKCHLETHISMSIPAFLKLDLCPHCGAMRRGEHWLEISGPDEGVSRVVEESLDVTKGITSVDVELDINPETEYVYKVKVFASIYEKGMVARREGSTTVRVENHVCDVCSRRHGNYYESIVQLRLFSGKMGDEERERWEEEIAKMIENMSSSNRQVFLSKSVEVHGGLDFYLSTTDAGRILARELSKKAGASIKESGTMAGRKDGRDLYRITFSVRLPPAKIGDYILLDGEVYRVEKVNKDRYEAVVLKRGETAKIKRDADERIVVMGGEELVKEAVVVFESDDELQLLDPYNYTTIQLKKPQTYVGGEETVGVIKHEGQIYIA